MNSPYDTNAIEYFINHARVGRSAASSGGTEKAARLAKLLRKAIEDCPGVDHQAIDGLREILKMANDGNYMHAAKLSEMALRDN